LLGCVQPFFIAIDSGNIEKRFYKVSIVVKAALQLDYAFGI
jgi:hypothetical protein